MSNTMEDLVMKNSEATNMRHEKDDSRETKSPLPRGVLFISVIIPVRNEANYIRLVLDHLLSQNYAKDRYEILVVDGDSDDGTVEQVTPYVEKFENVRLLDNPKRLASAARNVGVEHARGDVVLIIDGHCEIVRDDLLQIVNRCFQESGADCLGRPQPLKTRCGNAIQRAIGLARSSLLGHHPDSFVYSDQAQMVPAESVAVAYRREVFAECGMFDECFDACEDYEFNHRLTIKGKNCYFHPDLAVWYVPRVSFRGLAKQLVRYGQGRIRLFRKHPTLLSAKTMIPAVFVLGLALGWIPAFLHPVFASIYLGSIALYVGIIFAFGLGIALKERSLLMFLLTPIAWTTIHVASGIGLLREIFFPVKKASSEGTVSLDSE